MEVKVANVRMFGEPNHAASCDMTLSTERKNRVLRPSATTFVITRSKFKSELGHALPDYSATTNRTWEH